MLKNSPMDEFPPEPSTPFLESYNTSRYRTPSRQSPFANYERNPFIACWQKCWGFCSKGVLKTASKGLMFFESLSQSVSTPGRYFSNLRNMFEIFFCQQKFGQNPGAAKGWYVFSHRSETCGVSCCVLRSFAKSGFATHTEQFQLYQCHSETRCSLLVQGNTELSSSNLVNFWLTR